MRPLLEEEDNHYLRRHSALAGEGRRRATRIALVVRRVRLGFLLIWRKHSPPGTELTALVERAASRHGELVERGLAAEEYHWFIVGERKGTVTEQPPGPTPAVETVADGVPLPPPGDRPVGVGRILYLNFYQADSGFVGTDQLSQDYVLACRFLHCGIIDRTTTLDQGFHYSVLDPIPTPVIGGATFAELCDTVGAELVAEALQAGRGIRVLWSGGIDSTAALIAIMKAAEARGCEDRVCVLFSLDSVHEYPGFFLRHIRGKYEFRSVMHPVSQFLDPTFINVTGEHGDQLFGSYLLEPYVRRGLGGVDYRDILPLVMVERLGSARKAYRVMRFLEPVIAAAPVPICTLFDALWWLNFSLKWQDVTLRLPAMRREQAEVVYASIRHFYRDKRFQAWALGIGAARLPPVWPRYKDAAKRYILAFTGDQTYYRTKEKEVSLRNVIDDPWSGSESRIFMSHDFQPAFTIVERRSL